MDKEQLLAIPELKLSEVEGRLNADNLDKYVEKLKWFVDELPMKEMQLKQALEEDNYDVMTNRLAHIWDLLLKIYADGLAEECFKLVKVLRSMRNENVTAGVTSLTTKMSALSIDIQMVLYREVIKNQAAKKAAQVSAVKDEAAGGKPCVLAVDDSPFYLNTLNSYFRNTSFKLVCMHSGQAALEGLKLFNPALFILDIEMPEMDGYELAGILRERGYNTPIIFLTGNAKKEYVIKAMQAGGSDFIVKPITKEQVFERIGKFIEIPDPEQSEEINPEKSS